MKTLKNWKYFKEDIYYEPTPIYETDEETIERIENWVKNWIDEQVGLDIVSVYVSRRTINVNYKKGERWEDRKINSGKKMDRETAMEISKKEWAETGEELVKEMRYDSMSGYENGLGLDLGNDYYIRSSPNGFSVESNKDFPKIITGYSRHSFGGYK